MEAIRRTALRASSFLLVLLLLLGACASRTKYEAYEDKEGYRELPAVDGMRIVNFQANSRTKKGLAVLFAKFRAIELCRESGSPLTHILDVKDESVKKEVIRSSGTGFPVTYSYGMSPYYGRYSGFGVGISTTTGSAWEETYIFPDIRVYFQCVEKALGPELLIREVPKEEMKLLVKDLRGGLQVEKVLEGSPNIGVLEEGDVVVKLNGKRIESASRFFSSFGPGREELPAEILREGERRKVLLKSNEVTEHAQKAQEDIIKRACEKKEVKERPLCS